MKISLEDKVKQDINLSKLYEQSMLNIYSHIAGSIYDFSCHKFASNVIEKCLIHGSPQQIASIMLEVLPQDSNTEDLENDVLVKLMNDKFGNYVI